MPRQDAPQVNAEKSIRGEYKTHINESVTHITGMFGFILAGLVITDIVK